MSSHSWLSQLSVQSTKRHTTNWNSTSDFFHHHKQEKLAEYADKPKSCKKSSKSVLWVLFHCFFTPTISVSISIYLRIFKKCCILVFWLFALIIYLGGFVAILIQLLCNIQEFRERSEAVTDCHVMIISRTLTDKPDAILMLLQNTIL